MIKTAEIKNAEILSVGTWNGTKVSESDLDEMVSNFQAGVIEPYLNLDHDDKFTDRVKASLKVAALGYVSALRREGEKLIADFKQVPERVAALIESGAIKKRSVEFFRKGFKQNGKVWDNVLKAVSFFGADIPAVNNLSDDFAVLMRRTDEVEGESKIIILTDETEKKMDKIEIEKAEYEGLVSLKASAEKQTAEMVALKADLEAKEKELASLVTFKAEAEKANAEKVKADAEAFILKAVTEGKLLPAHKDYFVGEYIAKANDSKLEIFKADIEGRNKIISLADTSNAGTPPVELRVDTNTMDTFKIDEIVTAQMKKDNSTYEAAAKKLGVPGF